MEDPTIQEAFTRDLQKFALEADAAYKERMALTC
jgi:hypothetical protein